MRPEDEPLYGPFFAAVTPQDLRLRFFAPVKEFGHAFIARFTQIDYARAMAFIAIDEASGEMLGVVRLHADANYERGEYAVLVRSDLKGRGLGYLLMQMIIEYARAEGLEMIEGQVLSENTAMLAMCRELGFEIAPDPHDPDTCVVKLALKGGLTAPRRRRQNAQRSAVDVVVLAAAQRPEECDQPGRGRAPAPSARDRPARS